MSGIRISVATLEKVKAALQLGVDAGQEYSSVNQLRVSCLAAWSALVEDSSALGALSHRERAVFTLTGQGRNSHEIAQELELSPKTADAHKHNIRNKLGLKNSRQLLVAAVRYVDGLGKAKGERSES